MSLRSRSSLHLSVFSILTLLAACASAPPDPTSIESMEEVSATVQGIDVEKRLVTLRDQDGATVTVQVAPEVRNLAQVKAGDQVVVRYYEALAAELRSRGDGSGSTQAPVRDTMMSRAAEGARPAALVGEETRQTVRIASVDKKNHIVSFYASDGLARSVPVRTPQGQEFISKLKPGDEVELTYTEALAVSVEPTN
jgi:Cu/Ag efflux protein CusF